MSLLKRAKPKATVNLGKPILKTYINRTTPPPPHIELGGSCTIDEIPNPDFLN